MLHNGDFLYMVTWEPNALIARIPDTNFFCSSPCGGYSYCSNDGVCACANGYIEGPEGDCITFHQHQTIQDIEVATGWAVAFGILSGIALLLAIAGWALWWRRKNSFYSQF